MKRILVIDDEDSFRLAVRNILRKQGYDTLEATRGDQGLELARAHLPDLVVSDVKLGGMDGFEVLKALRSQPATSAIPVILMTGLPQSSDPRYGVERGADDYLAKPFAMETLLGAVRVRLERHRAILAPAKASETRLLQILAASQDLVAIIDSAGGHLLYLNRAGRKMLAISPGEDLSTLRLADFQAQERTAESHTEQITRAEGCGVWLGESIFRSRDGGRIPVSVQILSHAPVEGETPYLSIVARDMTERLEEERERQRMEVQLRQAQKLEAIGQLAAGIAHEINTPTQYVGDNTRFLQESFQSLHQILESHTELLRAAKNSSLTPELIAGAEQLLQATDPDYLAAQIPAAINESLEGIGRITKIVRAMKEFSHPGGKERVVSDLNKAIETTVTVARNEWKYVAEVKLDLDPELPAVPCFLGEFNQTILNLVINAAHTIGDVVKQQPGTKGLITIQSRRDGDYVEIRVSDTGAGIPEPIRPRIFEPFFTTKEVGKGTGQGLCIVYNSVVKKHGGTVRFESEAGKGTVFILRLPVSARPGGPEGPPGQTHSSVDAGAPGVAA